MSSSRKDYVAVAVIIHCASNVDPIPGNSSFRRTVDATRLYIAAGIADHFAADNPAFDRARFLKACGVAS